MTVQIVEGIIAAINKRIEAHEEIANDLAHDFIRSKKEPPIDIKERYENISTIVEGLQEAIDIIKKGDYMVEHVDLSGGEDNV